MSKSSGISFSANEPTRRSSGGMKRSARMVGFDRIGQVGIPTELRRQKSLGDVTIHGRLLPRPLPPPNQLRRTLSTLSIIPATPSLAPPLSSRRNTVSNDFDTTPKKRQPYTNPTPHQNDQLDTENQNVTKEYGSLGLGRRTRTKTGDGYSSLQDVNARTFFREVTATDRSWL